MDRSGPSRAASTVVSGEPSAQGAEARSSPAVIIEMKCLVAGWFSFEQMGATAGDLIAKDLVCQWLERAGYSYDVAYARPFQGGVYWRDVDPLSYTSVV